MAALTRQLFDESKSTFVRDPSALADALHQAMAPDFKLDTANEEVGFIRRKLPDADIYFVANTSNHPVSARAAFATTHKFGQRWDADTGEADAGSAYSSPVGIALRLAAYESAIFVFGDQPAHASSLPGPGAQIADLSEGWKVTFPSLGRSVFEEVLADWTSDAATRFYSGEADYERSFTLGRVPNGGAYLEIDGGTPLAPPADRKGPGMLAWYEPPVREAAVVFINGRRAGSLWHPPYRLAVDGFLKQGENRLVVKVYNTAINAWAAKPRHDYQPLIAKYGDRFQMQDLDQVRPVSSGLLGKIRLAGGDPQE
jgi:hypothetical protein